MTYDEFERIGMSERAPYALCKLAWELKPWKDAPYNETGLRVFFADVVKNLPREVMERLKFISCFEIKEGTLEQIAREWKSEIPEAGQ